MELDFISYYVNRHVKFLLLVITVLVISGSCSINKFGTVDVGYYENESAYLLRIESSGIHLMTSLEEGGLTVGKASRVYIYPKEKSGLGVDLLTSPELQGGFKPVEHVSGVALDIPYYIASESSGLVLELNKYRLGLSLGVRTRRTIRLPVDSDIVFMVSHGNGNETGSITANILSNK